MFPEHLGLTALTALLVQAPHAGPKGSSQHRGGPGTDGRVCTLEPEVLSVPPKTCVTPDKLLNFSKFPHLQNGKIIRILQ